MIVLKKTYCVRKPVLLSQNIALNSDAVPNGKHMVNVRFASGPSTTSVKHHSETHTIIKMMKQSKWRIGELKPECMKNTQRSTTHTIIKMMKQSKWRIGELKPECMKNTQRSTISTINPTTDSNIYALT